ncbi:MAG: TlpA disulfide reductase family protein [Pirellulaceae bacterium]|nr:TlpA disulfide reductase family protein [Pirellulaceae bacterium]
MSIENRPSKIKSLLPLVWAGLFMLVGILILIYLGRDKARLMHAQLDDIELIPLLNTEETPTIESLTGKIVVFHFWGTWSEDSREGFPRFVDIYRRFSSNPQIEFLSVCCSPGTESDIENLKQDASAYLGSLDLTMPTYADPAMYTRGKITRMLASGGFGYPFTMVADRHGMVVEYWLDAKPGSMKEFEKVVERLVEKESLDISR